MLLKTRKLPILVLASFAILALMTFIPTPASAYSSSGNDTILSGEYLEFTATELGSGSTSWSLTYSFTLDSSDPNIDVFVMRESEFSSYSAGSSFYYVIDCSMQNVRSTSSHSCSPSSTERYVLVFDNSNQGSATPYGYSAHVHWTVYTSGGGTTTDGTGLAILSLICLLPIIIVIVIVIVIIIFLVRRKQQPPAYQAPPPQPYSPPPAPYQQPYQQPYQPPPDPYQQPYQQPPPPPQYGAPPSQYGPPPPPPYR